MIALHAQGRKNDTIWLNSKLEPYKFNEAISDTGAYATESPRTWSGGGEGNVFSVGKEAIIWDGDPRTRLKASRNIMEGGIEAPPRQRSELSQGRAKGGGGGG